MTFSSQVATLVVVKESISRLCGYWNFRLLFVVELSRSDDDDDADIHNTREEDDDDDGFGDSTVVVAVVEEEENKAGRGGGLKADDLFLKDVLTFHWNDTTTTLLFVGSVVVATITRNDIATRNNNKDILTNVEVLVARRHTNITICFWG